MRDRERVESYFLKRIKKTETCWIWIGCVKKNGYGMANIYDHPPDNAHRISYKLFKGDIPKGMQIDHLCRFKACVNPDHLEMVTQKENHRRNIGKIRKNPWTTTNGKNDFDWEKIGMELLSGNIQHF